jgi:hypothetical protein
MPDLDPAPDNKGIVHEQDDEAELAQAYEALDEDRRQQADLAAAQASISTKPVDSHRRRRLLLTEFNRRTSRQAPANCQLRALILRLE